MRIYGDRHISNFSFTEFFYHTLAKGGPIRNNHDLDISILRHLRHIEKFFVHEGLALTNQRNSLQRWKVIQHASKVFTTDIFLLHIPANAVPAIKITPRGGLNIDHRWCFGPKPGVDRVNPQR